MLIDPVLAAGRRPAATPYDADIIILSLDRLEDTLAAIRSALAQTGVALHVIVVDQGSRPENRAALAAACAAAPNAALFFSSKNLGVAGGRNFASAAGDGRIIVALDNDAVFGDELTVARAVQAFGRRPELGALGFRILTGNGGMLDDLSWGYPEALKPMQDGKFGAATFVGAGHAIRRTAWEQAGGYDPNLFFTWEEFDFCLRAIALGWTIEYDGTISVHHKVSPESRVPWSGPRTAHYVRNRLIIARKWGASWAGLAPRIAGYILRGLLNHRLLATCTGIARAVSIDDLIPKAAMPAGMKTYLHTHDFRHRGGVVDRIRNEVFQKARR